MPDVWRQGASVEEEMGSPVSLGLEAENEFSRADLMTPFSLTLAAEKAIENAKQKLDEMDSRLLNARTSIARAQRIGGRAVSNPEKVQVRRGAGGRLIMHSTNPAWQSASGTDSMPVGRYRREHERGMSLDARNRAGDNENDDIATKTLEMKKLRDDLRSLRSRMAQTRAISETLNLTPPRPPRPHDSQIPDFQHLDQEFCTLNAELVSQLPLSSPTRSMKRQPPRRPSTLSSPSSKRTGTFLPEDDSLETGIPLLATKDENPFSPRPYSSQSILTWESPSTVSYFPKPVPNKMRPSLRVLETESSMSRASYTTARTFLPQETDGESSRKTDDCQHSSTSTMGEYSDPDTSTTDHLTRTPTTPQQQSSLPTTPNSAGSSPSTSMIPRLARVRPMSSMSTYSFGSLTGLVSEDEGSKSLVRRVESAITRLSMTEEDAGRRRKLEAALAILEEEE